MNIAKILKYCPKGTKLYSTIYGNVILDSVLSKDSKFPIIIKDSTGCQHVVTEQGHYMYNIPNLECVLFPSKDMRDWSKFRLPVKRGNIMMSSTTKRAFIASGGTINSHPEYICGINAFDAFQIVGDHGNNTIWTSDFYIPASEEAKEELFDKMEEAGYKWNADTLKLEKIESKFKEGDVVVDDQGNLCLVSKIRGDSFIVIAAALYTNNVLNIFTSNTVSRSIQLVNTVSTTDRNKLYSALVRKGYKYDKEQHLLIKQEFKPFDKVLVRDNDTDSWKADIYLGYDGECKVYHYKCARANYAVCIPYEGNEYLLDTTDSPM